MQRRPILAAPSSSAVILVLAAPVLAMKLNLPDESTQPRGTMGCHSYQTMARGFGPGFNAPLFMAAKLPPGGTGTGDATALRGIEAAVGATAGVARVTPPVVSADHAAAMMIAYPATSQQDTATNDMVHRLRDTVLPHAAAGAPTSPAPRTPRQTEQTDSRYSPAIERDK